MSIASFDNDELNECVDFEVQASDLAVAQEAIKKIRDEAGKGKGQTVLAAQCAEAIKNRIALATCHVEMKNALGASNAKSKPGGKAPVDAGTVDAGLIEAGNSTLTIVSRYYSYETVVKSDAYMRQCLQMQGTWTPLARDSSDFLRAEQEWKQRRAEKRSAP